jgi:hypothetical protein
VAPVSRGGLAGSTLQGSHLGWRIAASENTVFGLLQPNPDRTPRSEGVPLGAWRRNLIGEMMPPSVSTFLTCTKNVTCLTQRGKPFDHAVSSHTASLIRKVQ